MIWNLLILIIKIWILKNQQSSFATHSRSSLDLLTKLGLQKQPSMHMGKQGIGVSSGSNVQVASQFELSPQSFQISFSLHSSLLNTTAAKVINRRIAKYFIVKLFFDFLKVGEQFHFVLTWSKLQFSLLYNFVNTISYLIELSRFLFDYMICKEKIEFRGDMIFELGDFRKVFVQFKYKILIKIYFCILEWILQFPIIFQTFFPWLTKRFCNIFWFLYNTSISYQVKEISINNLKEKRANFWN